MKYLEDYVNPSTDQLQHWTLESAKEFDALNKEIFKRNQLLVRKAKAVLAAVGCPGQACSQINAPAVQLEYARVLREQIERDKEAASME